METRFLQTEIDELNKRIDDLVSKTNSLYGSLEETSAQVFIEVLTKEITRATTTLQELRAKKEILQAKLNEAQVAEQVQQHD